MKSTAIVSEWRGTLCFTHPTFTPQIKTFALLPLFCIISIEGTTGVADMNDEIKSAREIAMAKLESLGEITEEERLTWKYLPEGEKLAAKYIKQECELTKELSKYDAKAAKYVRKGASEILIRNIALPKDELTRKNTRRAMDGIKDLKKDKVSLENVFSQLRRIFNHYSEQGEQQKKQAYEQLKAEFAIKIQQAIKKQMGTSANIRIDVEKQPQFQEEWLKLKSQLESQYLKLLDEYKHALSAID
jgi:hypothetical protein